MSKGYDHSWCRVEGPALQVLLVLAAFAWASAGPLRASESATLREAWRGRYDSRGSGVDEARAATLDLDGNLIVVGHGGLANIDLLAAKYDEDGKLLWLRTHDGPAYGRDAGTDVKTDADGNVVVAGIELDDPSAPIGAGALAVVKYDPEGRPLWTVRKAEALLDADWPAFLALDGAGNAAVAATAHEPSRGVAVVVGWSRKGEERWTQRYHAASDSHDMAQGVAFDVGGDALVAVRSVRPYRTGPEPPDYTLALLRIDPSGRRVWTAVRPLGEKPGYLEPLAVGPVVDGGGNAYVVAPQTDAFVLLKYDRDGNLIWASPRPGPDWDGWGWARPYRLALDAEGAVLLLSEVGRSVLGETVESLRVEKVDAEGRDVWTAEHPGDGDVIPAALAATPGGGAAAAAFDGQEVPDRIERILTVAYDSGGRELWARSCVRPGDGRLMPVGIFASAGGGVEVAGTFRDDLGAVAYDAEGRELWRRYSDVEASGADEGTALAVDAEGNVLLAAASSRSGAIVKRGPDGSELWTADLPGADVQPVALGIDAEGYVHVACRAPCRAPWESFFFVVLTPGGSIESTSCLGADPARAFPRAMAVDPEGFAAVTGWMGWQDTAFVTVLYHRGREVWKAFSPYGPGRENGGRAVALDGERNVVVAGMMDKDYVALKYSRDGVLVWERRYDAPGGGDESIGGVAAETFWDRAVAVAVDPWGSVVLTGDSFHVRTFFDYATVKYDRDGKPLWAARYAGLAPDGFAEDRATAVAVSPDGGIYVSGISGRAESIGYDVATMKYDAEGRELWVARSEGPGSILQGTVALALDAAGNVHVGATANGDFVVVKYDASGRETCRVAFDGPTEGQDELAALAVDGAGSGYAAGTSEGGGTGPDAVAVKYLLEPPPALFLRGDCDGDGKVGGTVTDAVVLLLYSFAGGAVPPCLAACDANGDGSTAGQVSDAVYLLAFSFLAGPPPLAPFPSCGYGLLPSDPHLGCERVPALCP